LPQPTGWRRSISRARQCKPGIVSHQRAARFAGPIFLAALALLLLDTLIVLFLAGGIQRSCRVSSRAATASVLVAAAVALTLVQARAQSASSPNVPQSALETKLAYVVTGNADADTISKPALRPNAVPGAAYRARTGRAIGLDIAHDELAFYPLDLLADRARRRASV